MLESEASVQLVRNEGRSLWGRDMRGGTMGAGTLSQSRPILLARGGWQVDVILEDWIGLVGRLP